MKANDEYIRFIFLTGIYKFARFGVFSTLNHTTDISLMPEYAGICGYTEEEIIRYFPDYLEDTAKEIGLSTDELIVRMRHYYNGFCFDSKLKERLYNPYSTLSFFFEKVFADFWVETGRSKVIADYMKHWKLTAEQLEIKIEAKRQNAKRRAMEAFRQIADNNYAVPFADALCVGIAIIQSRAYSWKGYHSVSYHLVS